MTRTTGIAILAGPREPHDRTDWRARHNSAWQNPTNNTERAIIFLAQSLGALEGVHSGFDPDDPEFDYYLHENIAGPVVEALLHLLSYGQRTDLNAGVIDLWARNYARKHALSNIEV